MLPTSKNSIRLFTYSGITVSLHWLWFLVAYFQITTRENEYEAAIWKVWEYLALFGLVLLHEFGHSLACRSVGGQADQILLWPFGGVAFVNPPQRPGATLWSIAAGPLVNVAIGTLLWFFLPLIQRPDLQQTMPDALQWLRQLWRINLGLLIFNLLPIYPLDGGQILRSLLWFFCSAGRSLQIAVGIGFLGVAVGVYFAIQEQSWWLGVLCYLGFMRCLASWRYAQLLLAQARTTSTSTYSL